MRTGTQQPNCTSWFSDPSATLNSFSCRTFDFWIVALDLQVGLNSFLQSCHLRLFTMYKDNMLGGEKFHKIHNSLGINDPPSKLSHSTSDQVQQKCTDLDMSCVAGMRSVTAFFLQANNNNPMILPEDAHNCFTTLNFCNFTRQFHVITTAAKEFCRGVVFGVIGTMNAYWNTATELHFMVFRPERYP
nr:hypothetical protein Iba_chr08cCG4030 [Ipomoea batatas]